MWNQNVLKPCQVSQQLHQPTMENPSLYPSHSLSSQSKLKFGSCPGWPVPNTSPLVDENEPKIQFQTFISPSDLFKTHGKNVRGLPSFRKSPSSSRKIQTRSLTIRGWVCYHENARVSIPEAYHSLCLRFFPKGCHK